MTKRAVIYTRISSDDEGRGEGVERQEEDCRALAAQRGYEVAEIFTENDISASARSRKPRPLYEEMIRRAREGEWDALIALSSSRFTRKTAEAAELSELRHERKRAGRPLRLLTVKTGEAEDGAFGKFTTGFRALLDEFEADNIAERVEDAARQRAQKGRPNGRVAYGWDRVHGADVPNVEEAATLREIAERVLDGEKLLPIARDLNSRGVESPSQAGRRRAEERARAAGRDLAEVKLSTPKPWDGSTIRKLLLREANCGRRVFNGAILAVNEDVALWPEGQQEQLRALLTDPSRTTTRGVGPKRLMTGILVCGRCGGRCRARLGLPLSRDEDGAALDRAPEYYECEKCFGVRSTVADVDGLAETLVLARLTGADGPTLLADDPAAARAARDELATLRARLDNAADDYADGAIDRDQLRRITERLRGRIAEEERKAAAAMPSPAVAKLAARAEGIEVAWSEVDLGTRRDVARALATFILRPARAKGVRWTRDRLGVEWIGDDVEPETANS